VIWDINPFDQWGVELGKEMATALIAPLSRLGIDTNFDSSTDGLLAAMLKQQDDQS
jgi:glucose-6-phosphate isomerase